MRKIIILIVLALLITSCDKKANQVLKELPKALDTPETTYQQISESQKITEKLAKTTPLTETELQNAFPKKINDLDVDDKITVIGQQIIGSFGKHKITLSVMDAAGINSELGGYFIDSYTYNKEEETDNHKIIHKERNGIKTITNYYVYKGGCEINFLYENRYYIMLGNNDNEIKMNPDELWNAFDINALKKFK